MNDGFTVFAPQFIGVNQTEDFDLTSLIVLKDGKPTSDGNVYISPLNSDGKATETYQYTAEAFVLDENGIPLTDASGEFKFFEGWVGSSPIKINPGEVMFKSGQGFWVQATLGYTVQMSGKVSVADVTVDLAEGFSVTGNSTPATVDLVDVLALKKVGKEYVSTTDAVVYVSPLNSEGKAIETYQYTAEAFVLDENGIPLSDESGEFKFFEGWVGSSPVKISRGEVEFKPGEGLWIQSNGSNYAIRFPSTL